MLAAKAAIRDRETAILFNFYASGYREEVSL